MSIVRPSSRPTPAALTLQRIANRLRAASGRTCAAPPFLALTDPVRTPDPFALARALPAGAGLIYRHFGAPDRALVAAGLARLARARRLVFLIAGDFPLAVAVGAAGLHAPEAAIAAIRRWRARWPNAVITAAAHSPRTLVRAANVGADAALLSPVFATRSRPGATPIGAREAIRLAADAALPVYALGGVSAATASALTVGLAGLAAIDGIGAQGRSEASHRAAPAPNRFRLPEEP